MENAGNLKGAGDAHARDPIRAKPGNILAPVQDAADIERQIADQNIEQGGLARSVRTDEADDFPLVNRKAAAGHGLHPAKPFRNVTDLENSERCCSL